jgi:hypothetical protein
VKSPDSPVKDLRLTPNREEELEAFENLFWRQKVFKFSTLCLGSITYQGLSPYFISLQLSNSFHQISIQIDYSSNGSSFFN